MVAEEYLPPTATKGAWALMSPAQVDPGSPLLKLEKKEDTRRGDRLPTWRTSSPFVKDHVVNVVISEYLRKNQTRLRVAAAAQRLGATANVAVTVPGGCGNGDGNDAEPRPPDVQCSVKLRGISYLLPFG